MNTSSNSSVPKIVGAIVAILVCCACVLIIGAGVLIFRATQGIPSTFSTLIPPVDDNPITPQPTAELERTPVDPTTRTTLETLQNTLVPENDPYELACRLQAICNVSNTVQAKTYKVGDQEKFWILNS